MAESNKITVFTYAGLVILCRVTYYIDAPLWIDYFTKNDNSTTDDNVTVLGSNNTTHAISPYFVLMSQFLVVTTFYGLCLLATLLWFPGYITDFDRQFPKKHFLVIGVAQGVSSILFNFGISGSRTAPYLQAVLSNFNIPIQFTTRFIVLRKRPTWLKFSCALVIMVAEFICLLPVIFPQLESSKAHREEGGSHGVTAVLWPMCVVSSMIPFALANTIMERSVKSQSQSQTSEDTSQLNIMYFLFWWNLFVFLTTVAFWWIDLIPGLGTSPSIQDYGEKMWFNLQCIFGGADCDGQAVLALGWSNYFICIAAVFSFATLLRVSEGANFLIIILTIRTPLLFLFWTLFEENPFKWNPQAHLSTWISLGAIFVIISAVILYDITPPEKDASTRSEIISSDDLEPLVDSAVNFNYGDVEEIDAITPEPISNSH